METVSSFTIAGSSASTPPTLPGNPFGQTPITVGPVTASSSFLPPGQAVTFTSTTPGTFSLIAGSTGTLTSVDTTHAYYTAPASVKPQHTMAGCSVGPPDAVFNTRIDSLPVNANSATWTDTTTVHTTPSGGRVTSSSAVPFSFQYSFAHNIIDNTVPAAAQTFLPNYTSAYNGQLFQIPPPPNKRESGTFSYTDGPNDHHLISLNHQSCTFYETYKDNMTNLLTYSGCPNTGCTAESGWRYSDTSYAAPTQASSLGGATDAAGFPLQALTLHASEVLDAVRTGAPIKHALRFTTETGYIYQGNHIWPAAGANGGDDVNAPPYGARFRMKSSVNTSGLISVSVINGVQGYNFYSPSPTSATVSGCSTAPVLSIEMIGTDLYAINITSAGSGCTNPAVTINGGTCNPCAVAVANTYSPYAQAILTAIKDYGLFLADAGSNNAITVDSDMSSDPNLVNSIQQVQGAGFTMNNFEAVDESSLLTSWGGANSIEVNPSNATGPAVAIKFVPSSGTAVTFPLALQAISVGTQFVHAGILAGEPAYTIPYWVNGDPSNAGATWTLANCSAGSSGCGSITSAGAYSPPATVMAGTSLTVTAVATAVADPSQSTGEYLTIYPAGTLRIDSGASVPFTDHSGNKWLPEQFGQEIESLSYPFDNDLYDPNSLWKQSITDIVLWQTAVRGLGGNNGAGDIYFDPLIVPNGTYDIHMDFGVTSGNNGPTSCWGSYNLSTEAFGPMQLVTQGVIQAHNWDPGIITKHLCRTPASVDIPAIVTNNLLTMTIATDAIAYNTTFINAYSVAPFTGTATWAIDTQQLTSVQRGGTVQMYVQDWGTGFSDPVWKVTHGPGSVSTTGLFTAPSVQPITTPATIQACSKTHPAVCGTATLTVVGAGYTGIAH